MKRNHIKRIFGSIFIIILLAGFAQFADAQQKVLIYTYTHEDGFIHENIDASIEALQKMGNEHGFKTDVSEDPTDFTKENLSQYDALIFSNTNDKAFTSDEQRLALVHYIEAGGSFIGIHGASTSESDWPWFGKMLGGNFVRHPEFQDFDVKVIDGSHPSTAFLDETWHWEDECYYMNQLNPANKVLLAADLTTLQDDKRSEYPARIFGDLFPLAWYRETEHGRVFYTALGHEPEDYAEPKYVKHLWKGIQWVLEDEGEFDYNRATTKSIQKMESE